MRKWFWVVFSLLFSQVKAQEVLAELPTVIDESSALICVQDSLFITLNDSGGDPVLFVINERAELLHTSTVLHAKNVDWEALATDGEQRIFIGDIGNNKNNRNNLAIYTVDLAQVLTKDTVSAEKISFSYPDQEAFPPVDSLLYFDAEAMVYRDDSLFIFTKNRTIPFDGIAKVYGLSITPGNQVAKKYPDIQLRPTHWTEDCITDATLHGDTLYLLTYSKIYTFVRDNNTYTEISEYRIEYPTQLEAICFRNGYLYLTDEKTRLGEPKLYRVKLEN
jgi:hypothetical protein